MALNQPLAASKRTEPAEQEVGGEAVATEGDPGSRREALPRPGKQRGRGLHLCGEVRRIRSGGRQGV